MSSEFIQSMDTAAYAEHRRTYIGGADAASILGVNPYGTRVDVWRVKTGRDPVADLAGNPHIARGVAMEPYVLEALRGYPMYRAVVAGHHVRHALYDYIGGTPDAWTDERVVEIKCPATYNLDRIRRQGLHMYWFVQGVHYHVVTGLPVTFAIWDYNAWSPFLLDLDDVITPEMVQWMMGEYARFWQEVQTDTCPDPETTPKMPTFVSDIQQKALDKIAGAYYIADVLSKEADAWKTTLKGQLVTTMGESEESETENFRISASRRGKARYVSVKPLNQR